MRTIRLLTLAATITALAGPLPAGAQASGSADPADSTVRGVAATAARDYRDAARFPAWTRPVEPDRPDPITAERTPAPHAASGPDGEPPRLTVWADEVGFLAPEPVTLFATVEGPAGEAVAGGVVTGVVRDAGGSVVGRVTYADDGTGPDARAGDGVRTARITLDPEDVPELAEAFLVEVLATLPDGTTRQVAAGFLYSNPWARLTGRFRDEVRDGDLVVLAEVEVERAGRFYLEGTLHTPSGEPVAWAQAAAELDAGRHWMELPYYGLVFHDRGAAGPFRLARVTLATTGAMPNALGPVLEDAHRIPVRPLRRYTARPFGDPDLLEAARRLEAPANGTR
ncbi:MAG: hypothetical protein ACLF0P_16135 [Thermoanaerobaculia bacterium]